MGLFDLFSRKKNIETKREISTNDMVQPKEQAVFLSGNDQMVINQQNVNTKRAASDLPKKRKANASTSKDEQYVFYYIKRFFPCAINRQIIKSNSGKNYEADVFIPELNIAIEYDGVFWHKDKYEHDVEKTLFFNSIGLYVIHIRETGLLQLPPFNGLELYHRVGRSKEGLHTNEYISYMLQDISRFCDGSLFEELSIYFLSYEQFCNDLPDINSLIYTKSVSNPVSSFAEFSFWDYEKNGRLKPDNVPCDANIKVFLKCPSGQTKHVNVSFVCGSGARKIFPTSSIGEICPFFGRHELCMNRCEFYDQKVIEFITSFIKGTVKIENLSWFRLYALNNDAILSYVFKLFINNNISKSQLSELILDGDRSKYLLRMSWPVDICTNETLQLLLQAQVKYNTFSARFDAIRFDVDERSRNTLIQYLDSIFEKKDPYWRGVYLNEVFCIAHQKNLTLSSDLKRKLQKMLKKRPVQGLPININEWLLP